MNFQDGRHGSHTDCHKSAFEWEAQWLNGRVLGLRLRGPWFKPLFALWCVLILEATIYIKTLAYLSCLLFW